MCLKHRSTHMSELLANFGRVGGVLSLNNSHTWTYTCTYAHTERKGWWRTAATCHGAVLTLF